MIILILIITGIGVFTVAWAWGYNIKKPPSDEKMFGSDETSCSLGPYRTPNELLPLKETKPLPVILKYTNPYEGWHCPKCGAEWISKSPTYCECNDCIGGHFHLNCSYKDRGCKVKLIMLSKDNECQSG